MSFGGPTFILAIIAISTFGWIVTTAIRARYGYPVEGEWGGTIGKQDRQAEESARKLAEENDRLKLTVGRLEERLEVLERIATDPARQLTADIEQLR